MKLSDKESAVLASIELDVEKPIEKIRKETGLREHTIRYAIHSLKERGIILPCPFIDINALGLTIFNIFFSTGLQSSKAKDELAKYIIANKSVVWFAEMGADYPYGIGMVASQIQEAGAFMKALSQKFPGVFYEKALSAHYSSCWFPRRYLGASSSNAKPLISQAPKSIYKTDELDEKVLSGLANIPHKSRRELAQKLGTPLSTLELRISKLEAAGVLAGYYYGVDATKFGMLPYKLIVYAKGVAPELTQKLIEFARSSIWTVHLIECLGSWDYELNVEVKRPEDVVGITQSLYDFCGSRISSIKTLPVFKHLKFSTYPNVR